MRKNYLYVFVFLILSFSKSFAQQQQGISDAAARQIQSLLLEKESRTPVQKKIDSRLLYALKMEKGQPITNEVATLEIDVKKGADGLVPLEIKGIPRPELLQAIKNMGGIIVFSSKTFNNISLKIALQRVEEIAALPGVQFVGPAGDAKLENPTRPHALYNNVLLNNAAPVNKTKGYMDIASRWGKFGPAFVARAEKIRDQVQNALTSKYGNGLVGSKQSEGDVTHKAALARASFGVDGTGIKIGVQSDGVTNLAASQAAGDLGPVTVLPGQTGSGDEGTAMLEIVHDLAPGAQLYFASAFTSQAGFAQNILDLRTAGCDIICDDVFYYAEAAFQDDNVARSVNTVTAAGALYFSSAGNQGNLTDNTSSVWEGDFVDGGTLALVPGGTVNNFNGGTLYNAMTSSGRAILYWADPLGASTNDYDLFVLNAAGTTVVTSSTNVQNGTQDPIEDAGTRTTGQRIVILKKTGSANRALQLNGFGGGFGPALTFNTSGQTHGHSSAANAYSVAATPAATAIGAGNPTGPYPGVFTTANVSELFSSDGPRRIFFDPTGNPITAGNFLFATNGGTVRQKPDITAADGVSVTGVGGFGSPFYGTSAAAPHAAAIAGLIKQAKPLFTPAQIRTALTSTALDIEVAGVDRTTGAGIIMAYEALVASGATAIPVIVPTTKTITTESCTPNGVVDPGETVTVSFCLKNTGAANTTNLVGTLLATGGVTTPSAAQTYGVVNFGGADVCKSFTFKATGTCGGTVTATIQLQDGATNLGNITYTFTLGVPTVSLTQNFDALVVPALPTGWVTAQPTNTGASAPWVTSNSGTPTPVANSAPNSIFSPDPASLLDNQITTPAIPIVTSTATLTFAHNYNLENTFDGGVLEISIPTVAAGAFQDIVTAGGTFVSGGYSGTISTGFSSPIAGRSAWTGSNGGFTNVVVTLPATAAGQSIKLRFREASDVSVGSTGWRVDDIKITDGYACCSVTAPSVTINQSAVQADPTAVSPINFTAVFSEAVTGFTAAGVTLSGTAGATTKVITGGPTTYNIAVSGMTGSGTVIATIPANVATGTINILGNTASTSTDNTVTYNAPTACITLTGTISATDPNTSLRNFRDGVAPTCATPKTCTAGVAGTFQYKILTWTNPLATAQCVTVTHSTTSANFAYVAAYNGPVDLTNLCTNWLADGGNSAIPALPTTFSFNVPGSATVSFLVTNVTSGQTADYSIAISAPVCPPPPCVTLAGTISATDPSTSLRNFRDGLAPTCAAPKTCSPGVAGTFQYKILTWTNPVSIAQCVTVAHSTTGANFGYVAAYNGAIDLTNLCTNWIADGGNSPSPGVPTTFSMNVPGNATVSFLVTNVINAQTADYSITVTAPFCVPAPCVLTCPANVTVNNTTDQCGATVNYPAPTSSGACGTITATPASGSFFPLGTTTVNVSSTTGSTCSFTVTVKDAQAPVVTCPANIVVNNTTGVCGAVVNFPPPYATDNCGPTRFLLTQTASPTITAGAASCNAGGLHTDNSYYRVYDLSTLALGGSTFTVRNVSFGIERANAPTGSQPVTVKLYTLSGAFTLANLTLVGSQTFNVPNQTLSTFNLPLATPVLLTPATVPANAKLVVEIFTPSGQAAGNSFFIGTTTTAQTAPCYIAAATCGITQPTDYTAIGFGTRHMVIDVLGTVNTGTPLVVTTTPASGSTFPVGTTTVTSTTTDAAGNTGNCTFTVTVNDIQAPVITCPANIVKSTDPGICGAVVTFTPTATDNCAGVTITSTPASGSVFPKGVTIVTSKATDASGNSSTCTFTVTVNDTQAPVLTCPANITVNNTAGLCGAAVTYPTPTATDNCPLTIAAIPVALTQSSSTTVTTGNSVRCNTGGIQNDNSYYRLYDLSAAPLAGPLSIRTVTFGIEQATGGGGSQPVTIKLYTLTGAFTLANLTLVGSQIVTVPNQSNTLFTATLTTPPTVAANAKIVVELFTPNGAAGGNSFYIGSNTAAETGSSYLVATTCNITTPTTAAALGFPGMHIVLNIAGIIPAIPAPPIVSTPASGSVFPVGTTTVTSTTTDLAGNTATCSFTVTVKDVQAPVITCPANITQTAPLGTCAAIVAFTTTATDNCSATVVSTPASGSSFPVGVTTVTSVATDPAGNTASCTFTITVVDPQLPVISTQPQPTFICEGQTGTISVVATNAVSYQWQQFINGVWVNIAGATGSTLTLSNVTLAMNNNQYRVLVIGLCTTVTSNFVPLTIRRNPVVALTGASYINLDPSTRAVIYSTVSPAGTYTYQWTRNGVAFPSVTGPSFPLSVDLYGIYQVKVTDVITGCFGLSNLVTVRDSASSRLFVYPNPNNGNFQVRYYNAGGVATTRMLTVYDDKGARVFSKQFATSALYERMDVNISGYAAGIYMIEVRDASGKKLASAKVRKE